MTAAGVAARADGEARRRPARCAAWKPPISVEPRPVAAGPSQAKSSSCPVASKRWPMSRSVAALGAADRDQRAARAPWRCRRDPRPVRVVEVDDRRAALRQHAVEQPELGREIGLEVGVVVEVVAGEVGEARRREPHAVEPALVEPVAGCLHRRMGDALVGEVGEQRGAASSARAWCGERRARPRPRRPTVPKLTAVSPSASQICRVKLATEVLPLVPVTATHRSAGSPNQAAAAIGQRAARVVAQDHRHRERPGRRPRRARGPAGRSAPRPRPCRSAYGMKSPPWTRLPGQRREQVAGLASRRLSTERPVISGSGPAQSPARRVPDSRPSASNPVSLSVRSVPAIVIRAPPRAPATGLFVSGKRVKRRGAVGRASVLGPQAQQRRDAGGSPPPRPARRSRPAVRNRGPC